MGLVSGCRSISGSASKPSDSSSSGGESLSESAGSVPVPKGFCYSYKIVVFDREYSCRTFKACGLLFLWSRFYNNNRVVVP